LGFSRMRDATAILAAGVVSGLVIAFWIVRWAERRGDGDGE
jgi:phage head maturation protease